MYWGEHLSHFLYYIVRKKIHDNSLDRKENIFRVKKIDYIIQRSGYTYNFQHDNHGSKKMKRNEIIKNISSSITSQKKYGKLKINRKSTECV